MADDEPSKNDDGLTLRSEMINPIPPRRESNMKDNLLVPLGCLATISALAMGLWGFRSGHSGLSQKMMQLRVIAQGFTITAIVAGVLTAECDDDKV